MRWLFLEPYYDGSHRHLADGLVERLEHTPALWTLPARKWKWRMRGASLAFAQRFTDQNPSFDGILVSSMCNAAELRSLLPPAARSLPLIAYFHENQLRYPVQHFDPRDHHFAWTNIHTALAADRVLWNSRYNLESFLEETESLIKKMPDERPQWIGASISAKSEIFPVPLDIDELAARPRHDRSGKAFHLVWNHRWEFDKGPAQLLECVRALDTSGVDYELSVLGQQFENSPAIFDEIRAVAGKRVRNFGRLDSREDYLEVLCDADTALSTAIHEFQGLAILEAAACGATPLVPDDLAYREIWPQALRYPVGKHAAALVERARNIESWRNFDALPPCRDHDWSRQLPRWEALLRSMTADSAPPQ
jgi:glycosyltransferase involved in cell wall biosynthesis